MTEFYISYSCRVDARSGGAHINRAHSIGNACGYSYLAWTARRRLAALSLLGSCRLSLLGNTDCQRHQAALVTLHSARPETHPQHPVLPVIRSRRTGCCGNCRRTLTSLEAMAYATPHVTTTQLPLSSPHPVSVLW